MLCYIIPLGYFGKTKTQTVVLTAMVITPTRAWPNKSEYRKTSDQLLKIPHFEN